MTQGRATQGTPAEGRPLLNRHLAAFGTTIFAEMSALAVRRAPEFHPDLDELRTRITPCTRLLLLNTPHHPIAALPGMRGRTVSISSSGKTFSYTGWKIGWVKAC